MASKSITPKYMITYGLDMLRILACVTFSLEQRHMYENTSFTRENLEAIPSEKGKFLVQNISFLLIGLIWSRYLRF